MGARMGGGKSRTSPLPPPPPPRKLKKRFWAILGAFLLLFLHMGAFLVRFSNFLGAFSPCGGHFATFYFMVGPLFGFAPPPHEISAGAHDCKEGSRACSPEFFCVTQFSEFWTCFVTILP